MVSCVLYVRLPVWKIWPGGVVYLADFIHKERPGVRQEILDLALVSPRDRKHALGERLRELRPDVVAFSWRNMQTFGPHPENDALDVVMNYDHSASLWKRAKAAFNAISIIRDYAGARLRNFSYLAQARRELPDARIVVGGTAVSIFAQYVVKKCPRNTVVAVGEGEEVMLSVVDGFAKPSGAFYFKDAAGHVTQQPATENFDLQRLTAVDFRYIESIFPAFHDYLDDTIGVQTKRGCPFQCHFCLYNKIEGGRQRYRDPDEVVNEIESLVRDHGVKRVWFTDAQFCSTLRSIKHVEAILDRMISRNVRVAWTGYLRLNHLTPEIARKMLDSGLESVDLSFTGTQEVVDALTLGYKLDQQMAAFKMFQDAGHRDQKIKLYIPLNAPGETEETLKATIARIRELYAMFGRENVLPFIFFIGVQPETPIERSLIASGYLPRDYNPLTLNPFLIKKLLYNPRPLGPMIGQAYLDAIEKLGRDEREMSDYVGRVTFELLEERLITRRINHPPYRSLAPVVAGGG